MLAWPGVAWADLFSPGPLSKSHHALEGLKNCTLCHQGGKGLSQQKCLACHTELQPEVAAHQGFHGRIPDNQRECQTCHHEHQGLNFQLIEWVPSKPAFPHAKTGWALEGKHLTLKCEDCHQPRRISSAAVLDMLKKLPERKTFLGLPSKCSACHFDEHRGQLGADCEKCHTAADWKHTPGFHHENTAYPLTGLHRQVACEKCHAPKKDEAFNASAFPAPRAETYLALSDIPHAHCDDCHADPHQGKFAAQRCEACHSTAGWKKIHNVGANREFHDKTRFPLRGEHLDVDCKACHGPFPGQAAKFKGLAFAHCSDCHADAHLGQLAELARGEPPGCDACHSVMGFAPPKYSIADHAHTRFALEGAHQAVACNSCHVPEPALLERVPASLKQELARKHRKALFSPAGFLLQGDLSRCETCHRDPHGGQFAAREKQQGCPACHRPPSFHTLAFDHDRDSRYPLEGPHAKAPCAGCHRPAVSGMVRYAGTTTDCQACHADVHKGQFADARGNTNCARCHAVSDFHEAKRFEHKPPFTEFVLDGQHAKVGCERCHLAVNLAGEPVIRYVGLPKTCAECHQDFHHGAFQGFLP